MSCVAQAVRVRYGEKNLGEAVLQLQSALAEYRAEEYLLMLAIWSDGAERRRWLDEALTLAPGYDQAYLHRGSLRLSAGDVQAGVEDLDRCLEICPTNMSARINRGVGRHHLKNYAGAVDDYTEALAIAPNAIAFANRGLATSALKHWDAAVADFDRALALREAWPLVHHVRGVAKLGQEDFDGAVAAFTRCIELAPSHLNAYARRGSAHHRAGRPREAVADFEYVLRVAPRDWAERALVERCLLAARADLPR